MWLLLATHQYTRGAAPTLACCFSRTQEPWWSHGKAGRNLHPLQTASTVWAVSCFFPRSIMAHCAAGISGTGLHTELVEMPIHFNWNLYGNLPLHQKKPHSLFQERVSGSAGGSSLRAFSSPNDCSDPKWVVILGWASSICSVRAFYFA